MPIVPYVPKANIDAAQFGVRAGSGIDNADALERLNAFLKSSSIRHTVTFPAGLVQSTYTWWPSDLGETGVVINAHGTQFQSSTASSQAWLKYPLSVIPWYQTDARRASGGDVQSGDYRNVGYLIDTSNRGEVSVTLQTAGDASNFTAGDVVCIHGLDQQRTGTPRNPKFFEYTKVASVDGAVVTLTRPLRHTYHQSWPDVTAAGVDLGAPRISPTSWANNDTTRFLEIHGAEFLGHTSDPTDNGQPALYALGVNRLVECIADDCYVGATSLGQFWDCRINTLELDKIIERAEIKEGDFGGDATTTPLGGGTGLQELRCRGVRFNGSMTALNGGRIVMEECRFIPREADTSMLYFDFFNTVGLLEMRNNDFVPGPALNRSCVAYNLSGPKEITTTATSANHGAGQFAVDDTDTKAISALRIGCPVWEEEGDARGRVLAITNDGAGEYLITVDTEDTFTASSTLHVPSVYNVKHSGNTCDDVRQSIVGMHERDVSDQSYVIRLTDRQIFANFANYINRIPVGGNVTKVRVTVSRATSASKSLRLYMQYDSDGSWENGEIRFALNVEGTREYSATSNTLVSGDSVQSGNIYGWCSFVQLLNGLDTVADDDLPKYTLEIFVDQPSVATQGAVAFTDADATPSVAAQAKVYKTANTGATTITGFDDGYEGQEFLLLIDDANTTIDFTGTTLKGNGGSDWSPASGDAMRCTNDGTNWRCQVIDCTA